MDWKFLFLSGDGRIGRKDFWLGFALIMVASTVLGVIPILGQLIGLLLIWPQVCIQAKRLHDMGRTAWVMLAPIAVSIVCVLLAGITVGIAVLGDALSGSGVAAMAGTGMTVLFMGLAGLVGLAFLLWVGLTPSEPGENEYGEPAQPVFGAPPSAPPPGSSSGSPPPSTPLVE